MSDDLAPEEDDVEPELAPDHTEVQISIDGMRIIGPELTLEAGDMIISATGPDAAGAAESVRGLLMSLLDKLAERARQ